MARHVQWARTEGIAKLVEEDRLNPVDRLRVAYRKAGWRRAHPQQRGTARAVFLLGLQRSGTNMMARGLDEAPAFEVRNENDRAAFDRFRLRFDQVAPLVQGSGHAYVLFKPLCDSHRALELLDLPGLPVPPRALWAYRDVDGRVRSSVAKFGEANRLALMEIAETDGTTSRWEAGGLTPESVKTVQDLDPGGLSAASASALFWYLRNRLFFDLGLDQRSDVLITSYGRFVAEPERCMRRLCQFLELEYDDRLVAHVDARSGASGRRVDIDPRVRALCDGLTERLETMVRTSGASAS